MPNTNETRESAAPPKPPETDHGDYYECEDDDLSVPCPNCHGSGREWEGWECEYCDGNGYLDL